MPHKFNAGRRDKFLRAKYAVTNWSDYNEALRRRGDVTIWLEDGLPGNGLGRSERVAVVSRNIRTSRLRPV
jgi:hypothetical protein